MEGLLFEQNAIGFKDYQGCFAPYSELDNIIKNYMKKWQIITRLIFALIQKN
jgi:hypothetical protein